MVHGHDDACRKCNFPCPLMSLGWSVGLSGLSAIISLGGKLHFHAPIGALVPCLASSISSSVVNPNITSISFPYVFNSASTDLLDLVNSNKYIFFFVRIAIHTRSLLIFRRIFISAIKANFVDQIFVIYTNHYELI